MNPLTKIFNMARGAVKPANAAAPITPADYPDSPTTHYVHPTDGASMSPVDRMKEEQAVAARMADRMISLPKVENPAAEKPKPAPAPREPRWEDQFSDWYTPPQNHIAFDRKFFTTLMQLTGEEIFTRSEKIEIDKLAHRENGAYKALESVGFDCARLIVQAAIHENIQKVKRGETPNPEPDRAKLEAEFEIKRRQLRNEIRATRVLFKPIIAGVMKRLETASRRAAEKMEREERAESDKFGVKFAPSSQLYCLVWLAAEGFRREAEINHSTQNFIFGLFTHRDFHND